VKNLWKQLCTLWLCLPYFKIFCLQFIFIFYFKQNALLAVWVDTPTWQAFFITCLIIENCQLFTHTLGISRRVLNKIWAKYQFSIAEPQSFYQKLSFDYYLRRIFFCKTDKKVFKLGALMS
jgi:hypothetical protein